MENNREYPNPDYVRVEKIIARVAWGMVAFITLFAIIFWGCVFYFGWIH